MASLSHSGRLKHRLLSKKQAVLFTNHPGVIVPLLYCLFTLYKTGVPLPGADGL